jgi:hypothetical protein
LTTSKRSLSGATRVGCVASEIIRPTAAFRPAFLVV